MKILSYSGESVLTSDRIGDAVINYARALVVNNAADVIDIPVLDRHGAVGDGQTIARLLIGPSSQLIVIPTHQVDVELEDAAELESLRAKIDAHSPSRVLASDDQIWCEDELGFDYL